MSDGIEMQGQGAEPPQSPVPPQPPGGGQPIPPQQPPPPQTEVMGLISMILGILSFVTCCCGLLGLPVPITGAILGGLSLNKHKNEPTKWSGRGFAIAGLILSGVTILLTLGMLVLAMTGAIDNQGLEEILEQMQKDIEKKQP